MIALEGNAVDHGILDHAHDQRVALAPQRHIGEEAGGEERLQRAVDPIRIERIARLHQKIGLHRFRLDTLGAFDADFLDRAAGGNLGPTGWNLHPGGGGWAPAAGACV